MESRKTKSKEVTLAYFSQHTCTAQPGNQPNSKQWHIVDAACEQNAVGFGFAEKVAWVLPTERSKANPKRTKGTFNTTENWRVYLLSVPMSPWFTMTSTRTSCFLYRCTLARFQNQMKSSDNAWLCKLTPVFLQSFLLSYESFCKWNVDAGLVVCRWTTLTSAILKWCRHQR